VIDGDTLQIAQTRIRLFGIDAPEASQTCDRQGQKWACGKASAERLRSLISKASLSCYGAEIDVYGRLLATCTLSGIDLNQQMVADGWAVAFRRYSDRYAADEVRARAARLGLWSSNFTPPEEYLEEEREANSTRSAAPQPRVVTRSATTGCLIKGNRNRKGQWIYHLPDMPYYDSTRAEEMFCSEADAQRAGYRKSQAHW
jgi:hypothetical protein